MISPKTIITIEGNIGVGKTTLIDYIKNNKIFDAEYLYEPIDKWLSLNDSDNKNILYKFYDDKKKYAYEFQHIVYYSRAEKLIELCNNSNKNIIFMDRSLGTDSNVFEKMLFDDGFINNIEHSVYKHWDKFINSLIKSKKNLIYLKCDPIAAYNRMIGRGRKEEINISLEYIQKLHDYHEAWINQEFKNGSNVLILDCNNGTIQNNIIDKIKLYVTQCINNNNL